MEKQDNENTTCTGSSAEDLEAGSKIAELKFAFRQHCFNPDTLSNDLKDEYTREAGCSLTEN